MKTVSEQETERQILYLALLGLGSSLNRGIHVPKTKNDIPEYIPDKNAELILRRFDAHMRSGDQTLNYKNQDRKNIR